MKYAMKKTPRHGANKNQRLNELAASFGGWVAEQVHRLKWSEKDNEPIIIKDGHVREDGLELNTLENSNVRLWTHPRGTCWGEWCTIHKRSRHTMRAFPQLWRDDIAIMERICPHGIGHPDPDEINKRHRVHGCDGCCRQERLVKTW